MSDFMYYEVWWNSVYNYIVALVIFWIVYFAIMLFKRIVIKKIKILAEKTENKRDDFIIKQLYSISRVFYWVLYIYIPFQYIKTNLTIDRILNILFLAIVIREFSNILINIIKNILEKSIYIKKTGKKDTTRINLFHIIARIVVYAVWTLFFLSNIWVEITPFIASLWVMWIAVAFALQKILWDVFASFSIYLDRPFEIWDFIIIGTDSGIVKDIGIKSTRIQTLHWQELIIPNNEITSTRINNYGKMTKRRVAFTIWVIYQTAPKIIEKIPSIIKKIIENTENTEFSRAHFIEFWESDLKFEIVYFITTKEFDIYRDTHQKICLEIMKTFKKEWIWFAYPTQSIYIETPKQ